MGKFGSTILGVIAELDPAIHPLAKKHGPAGKARGRRTNKLINITA